MTWLSERLLEWFDQHGRRDLPWQTGKTPYRVWVSEVMLQQTQVTTVAPYFERFIERFADVEALAAAKQDEVLHHWTGLGYYARARNLHRAARQMDGALPDSLEGLMALPGIGRSTAGAILSIGFGRSATILDGNVKRVLARFYALPGYPGERETQQALWSHAQDHTPAQRAGDYAQAIMDFGATHCRRTDPLCSGCPLSPRCRAYAQGLQNSLPAPRPKKTLPVRAARMFLLIDANGACLLERRPEEGIWGGLWSPPERSMGTDVEAFSREWDVEVERSAAAPTFRHSFTHFHLDVTPHYLWVRDRPNEIRDVDRYVWYLPGQNQKLGLSAMAVKLLGGIREQVGEKFELA